MEDLIKSTFKKWIEAKRYAANRCRHTMPELASKLDECQMFTGEEDLRSLIDLMFEPRGREFMLANSFPTLATLRLFKKYQPEQYNVFIDSGQIEISNPERCFLIGKTRAVVKCNELLANNIILMHGAEADVFASGFAVVHIEKDRKSNCNVSTNDNARIL